MPYKLIKQNGKTCVAKESGTVVPGGCHADESKAKAHMRALYAAEGTEKKELTVEEMELVSKEVIEKCNLSDTWVPGGVTSFKDLDAWRETQKESEEIRSTSTDFQSLVSNILWNNDIKDKTVAIKTLTDEFSTLLDENIQDINTPDSKDDKEIPSIAKPLKDKVKNFFSTLFGWEIKETEPNAAADEGLMVWKETDGTWRWMARYSNKFRDRDRPPEIISSESHKRFVEKVDKGLAPYPELWLWHVPEYKWGKATWVGYDDAGFALALGSVDKGKEYVAEYMATLDPKSIRVSHGMPKRTIVRDPVDSTVIIEHETAEISPLPSKAAANVLTSFSILSKEDSMAIPTNKREALIEMGIPADVLDKLEAQNAEQAKEASESGIQSKEAQAAPIPLETPATVVPPALVPSAPVQKDADPVTPPASNAPTAQEIADAVSGVLNERLTAIDQRFNALEAAMAKTQEDLKSLKETDEAKIVKAAAQTPIASLSAMIARGISSSIGATETVVDGRSTLAKSKPLETLAQTERSNIGIMTVENIIREYDHPK